MKCSVALSKQRSITSGGDAEPIGIGAEVIYTISLDSKVPHLA
jgi:hypothetical protein